MNTSTNIPLPPRRWLLRFGLPVLVVAAAAALLLSTMWYSIMPAHSVRTVSTLVRDVDVPFDSTSSSSNTGDAIVQAPGWVEPDPFGVYAGALVEGVVKDMHVLEGDTVTTGQPVASLVDDDARIALQRAKANVVHLQAQLLIAETNLAQLPSRLKAARSKQAELEDEIRRKSKLVESGAVAAGPVARMKIRLDATKAGVEQLEIEEQRLNAAIMDAKALLTAGESERDDALLRLNRMTVVSPIDGVVIERMTSPGSVIKFGNGEHSSHIVHIYQPEKLQVRADVPLASAAMVRKGQRAEVVVDILPDQIFEGEITRFVHRADLSKNTVEAKVRIIDPSPLLKPDMLARVRILPTLDPETSEGMRRVPRTFVPLEAIVDGSVWIVDSRNGNSGVAHRQSITLGSNEYDGWVEVIDGLQPGDLLILDTEDLQEGDRVSADGGDT